MEQEGKEAEDSGIAEFRRELALAQRLAAGFEEMPIRERIGYAAQALGALVETDRPRPRTVPMELRVVEKLVWQVFKILGKCPSAGDLTEELADELQEQDRERSQPCRPAKMIPAPRRSDGPPR